MTVIEREKVALSRIGYRKDEEMKLRETANIRFIDIRPDTLNLDENQLPDLISPNTKAVAAMHFLQMKEPGLVCYFMCVN